MGRSAVHLHPNRQHAICGALDADRPGDGTLQQLVQVVVATGEDGAVLGLFEVVPDLVEVVGIRVRVLAERRDGGVVRAHRAGQLVARVVGVVEVCSIEIVAADAAAGGVEGVGERRNGGWGLVVEEIERRRSTAS